MKGVTRVWLKEGDTPWFSFQDDDKKFYWEFHNTTKQFIFVELSTGGCASIPIHNISLIEWIPDEESNDS